MPCAPRLSAAWSDGWMAGSRSRRSSSQHGALGLALLDLERSVRVRRQVHVLDGHHLPRRELDEQVEAVRAGRIDERVLRQDLKPRAGVRPSQRALEGQGVTLGLLDGDHVGAALSDDLHDLVEADVYAAVLDVELQDLELDRGDGRGGARLRSRAGCWERAGERECERQRRGRGEPDPPPEPDAHPTTRSWRCRCRCCRSSWRRLQAVSRTHESFRPAPENAIEAASRFLRFPPSRSRTSAHLRRWR